VHWVAETNTLADMIERGWSMRSFKPGDEVTTTVDRSKTPIPLGASLRSYFPPAKRSACIICALVQEH